MCDHAWNKDILQSGEFGEQVIKLENETEGFIAQCLAPVGRQIVDPLPFEEDFAFVRRVERTQEMEQPSLDFAGSKVPI